MSQQVFDLGPGLRGLRKLWMALPLGLLASFSRAPGGMAPPPPAGLGEARPSPPLLLTGVWAFLLQDVRTLHMRLCLANSLLGSLSPPVLASCWSVPLALETLREGQSHGEASAICCGTLEL